MSFPHHTPGRDHSAPCRGHDTLSAGDADRVAHELNNLLDGSLRSVHFALRRLDQLDLDDPTHTDLRDRLAAAHRSMHQMADVIERLAPQGNSPGRSHGAAAGHPTAGPRHTDANPFAEGLAYAPPAPAAELFAARGSLLDALTHAVAVYGPRIEQLGVELTTRLDPAVGDAPAGPVYTVLANALNNAVQAIERAPASARGPHRIALRIAAPPDDADAIEIRVTDTGPGLDPCVLDADGRLRFGVTTRPDGHGIGLGVCRQIAEDLSGTLTLTNTPGQTRGATLTLRYPRHQAGPAAGVRLAG
ncbi:MAG: HAMP domain-containing sensor histidine kinase [Planctomycetota bacterium]